MERLIHKCSVLLRMAIDNTTVHTYSSAANLYLTFCKLQLPVDPTPETLSYYITFQSTHINPNSVESYLSGICSNLEPFFPDIRANHATVLVKRTLKGACRRHGWPTVRKSPLTTMHLCSMADFLQESLDHDDILFLCMVNMGFAGLLQLRELTVSDSLALWDSHKVVLHSSLSWAAGGYKFLLPAHKSNTSFEGNRVHIAHIINAPDPLPFMVHYIGFWDWLFPLHPNYGFAAMGLC
jgi:hypothetical protein